MPTYEYRCPKGHGFEKFQRITEPPKAKCPTCGAEAERLLSPGAGVLFKGSGFYSTDYRSEGYKKAAEQEKSGGEAKQKEGDAAGKKTGSEPGGTGKGGGSAPKESSAD